MTHSLRICVGPTCGVNFSRDLLDEAEDRPRADLAVERCGCLGHCEEGPNTMLNGTVHVDMTPDRLRVLLAALPALPFGIDSARSPGGLAADADRCRGIVRRPILSREATG